MATFPTVGGSVGTWGSQLLTWLEVAHNSDGTLIGGISRSATATLGVGEFTVFSGSTASQTLTLPTTPNSGTISQICNVSSVSVTVAPGGSDTINDYGTAGNITLAAGQTVQMSYISGVWNVTSAPTGQTQVSIFTSGGTWTKPAGCTSVYTYLMSGSPGGGSGALVASGTAASGGGGSASGGAVSGFIPASLLPATVTVTVGAGGAGGAAQSTNSSAGNTGGVGGGSFFGTYMRAYSAGSGTGGAGQVGAGSGGGGGNANYPTAALGGGSVSGAAGSTGNPSVGAGGMGSGGGGGGGGGISATPTAFAGGNGGAGVATTFGTGGVVAGAVPTADAATSFQGAGGSGGGASSITGNGQAGANGAFPGGGAGGGGAALNGNSSGPGGTGGAGIVIVIASFQAIGDVTTIDTTASDIQPIGATAAAGSKGLAADAKHVHPSTGVKFKVYDTGSSGVALSTTTTLVLMSYTAPSDGNLHTVDWSAMLHVTTGGTGGNIITTINGLYSVGNAFSAGLGVGYSPAGGTTVVPAGDTFEVYQSVALTGASAAATFFGKIYAD